LLFNKDFLRQGRRHGKTEKMEYPEEMINILNITSKINIDNKTIRVILYL